MMPCLGVCASGARRSSVLVGPATRARTLERACSNRTGDFVGTRECVWGRWRCGVLKGARALARGVGKIPRRSHRQTQARKSSSPHPTRALASARSWHGLWSRRRDTTNRCDHHKPCQDRAGRRSATRHSDVDDATRATDSRRANKKRRDPRSRRSHVLITSHGSVIVPRT